MICPKKAYFIQSFVKGNAEKQKRHMGNSGWVDLKVTRLGVSTTILDLNRLGKKYCWERGSYQRVKRHKAEVLEREAYAIPRPELGTVVSSPKDPM